MLRNSVLNIFHQNLKKKNYKSYRTIMTKQIVYKEFGNPSKVLEFCTKELKTDKLTPDEVLVRWLAAPINPADLNQIQGVYPVKPASLPAVGGNEGCGVVEKIGANVSNLSVGDYVIPGKSCLGTWSERVIDNHSNFYRVPNDIPIIDAATLQVNPSTAYRMLKDFVTLDPGDYIIQNGANSAVGRYVIQLCKIWNLKSINVVRDRKEIVELKNDLKSLGANEVFTEEEFLQASRNFKNIKLGFNCVGGRSSLTLSRCLASNGCLVTYGGMSNQPIQTPTGLLIFNDIVLRGFWMTRWYLMQKNKDEQDAMYKDLITWIREKNLKPPPISKLKLDENFKKAFEMTENKKKQIFIY